MEKQTGRAALGGGQSGRNVIQEETESENKDEETTGTGCLGAASAEKSERPKESHPGSLHSGWAGTASVEAELLVETLKKQMHHEQQQKAAEASRAAAAEALPLAKKKLGECKGLTPLTLRIVRHPVNNVTLVPVAASAAATPEATAVADTAECGLSSPTTGRTQIDEIPGVVGRCGSMKDSNSSCNNKDYSSTRNMGVELLDVSLKETHLEERVLCACPELRPLLRRGLTLLEFTGTPRKQEQQCQTAQHQYKEDLEGRGTYLLVRRGLPKFFDMDWESLACFFLQASLQQQWQLKEKQWQQKQEKKQCTVKPNLQMQPPEADMEGQQRQQQQQPQGGQEVTQRVRCPVQQQQKQRILGKKKKKHKQAQELVMYRSLRVAKDKCEDTLLSAHQLSQRLLQCFAAPGENDNAASGSSSESYRGSESSEAGLVEVWALQKLNGDSGQISFCSQLKAWVCCSKNVCLFLPAAAATSSRLAMPGADAAPAAAAKMGADHLWRDGEPMPQGTSQLQEQSSSEQQQQQQTQRQAVKLLRQLGADRVVSEPFTFEAPADVRREHYALRVAAAWQQQLQQLTQTQVDEVKKLLQSHTLVGELIECAEKQHIVPAPKRQQHQQQQGQQQEERAGGRPGRLAFFALVPHKLESAGTAFCEPPCLSPGVALPLLQSLGLETVEVAARLQASSPVELLLHLLQLEYQRDGSSAGDTEGFVLYFCKRSKGGGSSSSSSSGSSPCDGGSTVVALAKAKTSLYQVRRKLRESLKCLISGFPFWAATAAAAAAAEAASSRRPAGENGLGTHDISSTVLETFAAATQAASAAAAVGRGDRNLPAGASADAELASGAAAVEAALRVQVSAIVGMYWCSVLETQLSRFDHRLKSIVHAGPSIALINDVLRLRYQGAAKEFPLDELQRRRLNFDSLVREESVNFRRAVAFSCSLAAALLLALRCLPDPQRVPLLWHEKQGERNLKVEQQQQHTDGACSDSGVQLQKDLQVMSVFQDLVHGPVRHKAKAPEGCLFRFLVGYVNFRFLDFIADSREFATATGAPRNWIAPPRELLTQLQRANSDGGQPVNLVRVADLKDAGATVLEQLQGNSSAPLKCTRGKQGEHVQGGSLQLEQQLLTVCLVVPPLLLTANQYSTLRKICFDLGCVLRLRHGACFCDCCCCYCLHGSSSTCRCGVCAKVARAAATDSCSGASLVVLWGADKHGVRISLNRLHQLLQQRQAQKQQPEKQEQWDYIALVGQSGAIKELRNYASKEGVLNDSSPEENRSFVADAVVGEAILKAENRTVAEGILALASRRCTRDVLEFANDSWETTQDLQAFLKGATRTSGRLPRLLCFPASVLDTEGDVQRAYRLFSVAVKAVVNTASNGFRSPAKDKPKAHPGPVHQATSPHGPQRVGADLGGGCFEEVNKFMRSTKLSSGPTPFASVVALLPVSLPGSGKTSVFLEALRPALRQEFMSSNTACVGGVTGSVKTVATTKAAAAAVSATMTVAAAATGSATATVTSTTATAAPAAPTVAGRPQEAVAATPAPLESVFDCVCYLSSDEFTGEALRSLGHNAPTGSLHSLCLQEASRVGPAAAARLNWPSCNRGTSSLPLDEKARNAAIAEGRESMRKALRNFFTQLEDTLVSRFAEEKEKQRALKKDGPSTAGPYRPLRVLVVLDRNHPPNAVDSRFSEVDDLLGALQSATLKRCGMVVNVATAAVLLPPDATPDGSSTLLRWPGGCLRGPRITWNYPWSIEAVLCCMYRVLCRGDHATLAGSRRARFAPLEELPGAASDADIAQDVKALHICLSFLSCFKGHSNIHDLLRKHPKVTHVLHLQTLLPVQRQQYQQEQLQNQRQLLLRALSSLKPFRDPSTNQSVLMALADSLRQFPPDCPVPGDHQANQCAGVSRSASELLQLVDSLFLSMEEPLLQRCGQLLQHQPQPPQVEQLQECQQQLYHNTLALCGRLQQPQGDIDQVTPEESHTRQFEAVGDPTSNITLQVPAYFAVSLEGEQEALHSLTQQLLAAAQSAGGLRVPSVVDICKALKRVDSPHVTTFFLGGGRLQTNRGEIEAANEWLDEQPVRLYCLSRGEFSSEGADAYASFSPRILCLHVLLASRRQTGLYFKFQVSHLILTDIGLACAALIPVSPILPLAEARTPEHPGDGPASLGLATTVHEVDAAVGKCGPACAVCGPHNVYKPPMGFHPLYMAAYHYPHVTLGLSGDATAVMSNDTIAAADKAILQGIHEKTLKADTPRPFRTGGPRNEVRVPEDDGKGAVTKDAYGSLDCYPVGDGDDPQELIVFSGVPIGGKRACLWVWSVPREVREELEGPVQAF
ncbi:hypothetical protein, conserved [Eimeria brunetti]|uniref:Uncharacterized protein n=1 Tax=Eimeria brunetti TaxID=51314 RepID=U6LZT0_9EIME|nr:hypothetical protein, conserved [Eimeria brunetti]